MPAKEEISRSFEERHVDYEQAGSPGQENDQDSSELKHLLNFGRVIDFAQTSESKEQVKAEINGSGRIGYEAQ